MYYFDPIFYFSAGDYLFGTILGWLLGITYTLSIFGIVGIVSCYEKMGLPFWKAFVPVYSNYCLYKKVWRVFPFWIYMCCFFSLFFLESEIVIHLVFILAMGIYTVMNIKMARRFGHSILFGLLMTIIPSIMMSILGLGKSEFSEE